MMKALWTLLFAAWYCFVPEAVHAQSSGVKYPTKPMRMLVGYTTGSSTDIVARIVANGVSARIGQQVVVENRPGGSATIAANLTAKAAPDGYTMTLGTPGAHATAPYAFQNLPYDTIKDFAPVALVGYAYFALIVAPQIGVKTVSELVALAKSRPGQLNYASVGEGSQPHMGAVLLGEMTGTQFTHIPYKGGAQSILDLAAGRVQFMFSAGIASAQGLQRDGKVRIVAVSGPRLPTIPDVPSMSETYPDYHLYLWYAVFMPAGTRTEIVARMNREIGAAVRDPAIRKLLADASVTPQTMTPEELGALMRKDAETFRKIVLKAGIKPQPL